MPPSQAIPIFLPAPAAAVAAIWWSLSARVTRYRMRSWSNTTARVVWINAATEPASPWTRRPSFAPSTSAGHRPAGSSTVATRCAGEFWAVRPQHLHELGRLEPAPRAPHPASGFAAGPDRQSADGVGGGFRLSTELLDSRVRSPSTTGKHSLIGARPDRALPHSNPGPSRRSAARSVLSFSSASSADVGFGGSGLRDSPSATTAPQGGRRSVCGGGPSFPRGGLAKALPPHGE